ncbi:MAG TPA: hypothetical protein VF306_20970 [Pirellulales bacterium]
MRALLMGGQACVLYGAAEFSRDTDLAILADADNLARLQLALDELRADRIAVPPFEARYLNLGLAIHFRCELPEAADMRIDVMSRMRGVDPFDALWSRRTTAELDGLQIELLSLPDLVRAKKTQRPKDWPMVVRLLEANYFSHRDRPSDEQLDFWLKEMRTASLLIALAERFPDRCGAALSERSLLLIAQTGDEVALEAALRDEEAAERAADRAYWEPLKRELERLRREARSQTASRPKPDETRS